MTRGLLGKIISNGHRGAVVPYSRIDDLKKDMIDLSNGEYRTGWINRMSTRMAEDTDHFIPPDLNFKPRSLITVIMPGPKVMLQFNYHSKLINCAVPSNYTNWDLRNRQVLQYINDYLTPLGFSVAMAIDLPQKLLAVHSGLGLYGRNNICYDDKFGTYMQIMTYISDLPCDDSTWFTLRRMKVCEKCRACVDACPTDAIDTDRRLVNSDRCISLFNENPGEFPEWLDKGWHNSIIGCTKCHDCCPANTHNKHNIAAGVSFTEEETTELMNCTDGVPYTDSLAAKIETTGISPAWRAANVFPRNLAVLLQKECDS